MASTAPPAPRSPLRARIAPEGNRLRLIAAVAGAVVLLDAATKVAATQLLSGHERIEILGGLVSFELYRNFAGPNDILPGHTVLISVFAIVAVAALAAVATRVVSTAAALVVGLMLGGAIGNLLDRLLREPAPLRGGVIDWLKLTDRSNSMNLADLAINAAVIVMVVAAVLAWWRGRQSGESEPPDPAPGSPDAAS
ncbi:MAG: signal peptidase II [Syntrophothermus sp.]